MRAAGMEEDQHMRLTLDCVTFLFQYMLGQQMTLVPYRDLSHTKITPRQNQNISTDGKMGGSSECE